MKRDNSLSKQLSKKIKTLRADEILNQRSAIPAVSMRKRPGGGTTNGIIPTKRQRSDWVSHSELDRLKRVADGQHENTVEAKDASYDLWTKSAPPKKKDVDDFMLDESLAKIPKTMKKKPLSLIANGQRTKAVPKPLGGFSYNPVFSDYQKRLEDEGLKAVNAERARLNAEETEKLKQEAAARSAAEAEAAELRADLSEWEEDSEWEGFLSGAEDSKLPAKRPERKTQAQRNRIKRRKAEERLVKYRRSMKARNLQEQRIREIADEADQRDVNQQLVLAQQSESESEEEVDENKLRRRQLGKYKLPDKDLELVLPDELEDSLRLLKPEGNLLKDRYRSMLVRGKMEARRHIPFKKQAKRKLTEKWTYKDFVI